MRGVNVLKTPEVSDSEFHAFRVATAESLGNPCVMKALTISKDRVSECNTSNKSSSESEINANRVQVEVVGSGLTSIVAVEECRTSNSKSKSWCTSKDIDNVVRVERFQVPVVGIVFNCFNALDFVEHIVVSFLDVVVIGFNVNAVASHYS